jgi:hypothetical protein
MIKFLKLGDNFNRLIFTYYDKSYNNESYFFKIVKTNSKKFVLTPIYHFGNVKEVCPKCGQRLITDSVCEDFSLECREVLSDLLESPELRLLQTTGELLHDPEFFFSDFIENHTTGMEQKVLKLFYINDITPKEIGRIAGLSESMVIKIIRLALLKI